jgi:hypothetical protein
LLALQMPESGQQNSPESQLVPFRQGSPRPPSQLASLTEQLP